MTKNFKILSDFEIGINHEEVLSYIEDIEKKIKTKDFDNIFITGRKILESIMVMVDEKYGRNLAYAIKDLTNNTATPSKVNNALHSIKNKGNENAHTTQKSDMPYKIKDDIFSAVEFIKQIFIVIKYFIKNNQKNNWNEEYESSYKFDSSIYIPKILENDKETKTSDTSDLKPSTESLTSELKGVFELISSKYNFFVPTYQREYTWAEENVRVFLQDISDRMKDKQNHYIGSIAVAVDNDKSLLRLIDGQQRITTSLLLIKCLYDRHKKLTLSLRMPIELENLSKNLESKYINDSETNSSLNAIKRILSDNFSSDKAFTTSIAYKNYMIIQEYINEIPIDDLNEFYTTFIYRFTISELRFTSDLGQEIQIFENLNSKGMELSQWDLIKNYIYKNIDLDFLIKNESAVEKLLVRLFVVASSVYFGDKNRFKELSNFFIYYSRIETKIKHNKVLTEKGKIHKIFKKIWPSTNNEINSLKTLENALLKASRLFQIFGHLKAKKYLDSDSPLFIYRLHLENTSIKDAHYAAIMNAIYNSVHWEGLKFTGIINNKKEKLKNLLSDIDKYITRLLIVNNVGQSMSIMFDSIIDNDLDKVHKKFIDKIKETGTQTTLPSYSDFQRTIKEKNDWQKDYALSVLRTIESIDSKQQIGKHEIIKDPSLEHIFPRKVASDSQWIIQENIGKSEFDEKHLSRLNKLGNYLILSKSINSKASNNNFNDKKEFYKKDNGILFVGKGEELMDLSLKSSFTFEDIDNRTKQLATLAAPLYKLSFE